MYHIVRIASPHLYISITSVRARTVICKGTLSKDTHLTALCITVLKGGSETIFVAEGLSQLIEDCRGLHRNLQQRSNIF